VKQNSHNRDRSRSVPIEAKILDLIREMLIPAEVITSYETVIAFLPAFYALIQELLSYMHSPAILRAANYEGGVGHMVAAALQTKGIIDQGKILANFEELKSIAALFYLFAIGMGIGAVAIFGNYRQGLYLVLGPVFFQYATTVTTETNGIKTKLGSYEAANSIQANNEFLNYIRAIDGDNQGATTQVSLLFATVDTITTEVIQSVIGVFIDGDNREHLKIVARENALSYAMMGISESTGLNRMVSESFMGSCSEVFKKALRFGVGHLSKVKDRERDQAELNQVRSDMNRLLDEKRISLDPEVKHFLKVFKGQKGFENVPDLPIKDDWIVSCRSVWDWIGSGFQLIGGERLNPEHFEGFTEDTSDIPWEDVYPDVKAMISQSPDGQGNNEQAIRTLSAYIFKNTLQFSTHAALQSQLFSHGAMNAKESKLFIGEIGEAERHGGFMAIKYFASVIPYIQGLLLYLLSIAYPFFAILLVIPGKASSFLVWCSLWVWVKSWDLGFAMVFVVRDLMWDMLKHKVNGFDQVVDWNDPSAIFALIMHNDPLASQNIYWEITSFLTVSVPLLTAQFCLGATNMLGMFQLGISETAGRFRAFETHRGRRHLANQLDQHLEDRVNKVAEMGAKKAMAMEPASASNPHGLQNAHGESIGLDDPNRVVPSDITANAAQIRNGALPTHALAQWKVSEALANIGTADNLNKLKSSLNEVRDLEDRTNMKLQSNANLYSIPHQFQGPSSLGSTISAEDQRAIISQEEGSDPGAEGLKDKSWGEFLSERAKKSGERLIIPHLMRGMPDLDAPVSKDVLDALYEKGDPLNNNEKATTWSDIYQRESSDRINDYASLAAVVGRKYAPEIAGAGTTLVAAAQLEMNSTLMFGGAFDNAASNLMPFFRDSGIWSGIVNNNEAFNGVESFNRVQGTYPTGKKEDEPQSVRVGGGGDGGD